MGVAKSILVRVYDGLGRIAFFGGIIAGTALLAWDILAWLQSGRWPHASAADALVWLGLPHAASNWIGLQQVLAATQTWLAAPALCFALLLLMGMIRSVVLATLRSFKGARRAGLSAPTTARF